MNTKSVIFFGISIFLFFYFGNQFLKEKNDVIDHKKITIFVLFDPVYEIHTKMITGERANVKSVSGIHGLTHDDIKHLKTDDIVLGLDTLSRESFFKKFSHFQGHYIPLPQYDKNTLLFNSKTLQTQIETVRDALSEAYPPYKNFFYDRAGNYLYLLDESRIHLINRLHTYTLFPFITLGSSFLDFIEEFDLKKYHVGHFTDLTSFDTKKDSHESVKYVFTDVNISTLSKKHPLNGKIFLMPQLTDDTSSYGYIKYMEKTVNEFVAAFDTYD